MTQARRVLQGIAPRYEGVDGLAWTVDRRLLYTAYTGDNLSIWSMNSDGGDLRHLTGSGAAVVDRQICATSDGRYMVFQSNRSGALEIWRANMDGTGLRKLTILVLTMLATGRADAAVTAGVVGSVLEIDGDAAYNRITVRVATGDPTRLDVFDEPTLVGSFVRGTFTTIQIHGNAGSDIIVMSHVNGPITEAAAIHGDAGDDSIRGSSTTTIDTIFGGPDNDNFNRSAGDGGDVFEGDTGHDVVNVTGSDDAETFAVAQNPSA